jgi:hypothetical protein
MLPEMGLLPHSEPLHQSRGSDVARVAPRHHPVDICRAESEIEQCSGCLARITIAMMVGMEDPADLRLARIGTAPDERELADEHAAVAPVHRQNDLVALQVEGDLPDALLHRLGTFLAAERRIEEVMRHVLTTAVGMDGIDIPPGERPQGQSFREDRVVGMNGHHNAMPEATRVTVASIPGKIKLVAGGRPWQRRRMEKKHTEVDLTGTCACGRVRLTVRGRVLSMFLCSCLDCQHATGTGHMTGAVVPAAALTVEGEVASFDSASDSGATFTRHFCPGCGNPLFGKSSRAPEVRMVAVGFFAGRNDWFAPSQLLFARSHQQWDSIADELPRYEKYRPERAR